MQRVGNQEKKWDDGEQDYARNPNEKRAPKSPARIVRIDWFVNVRAYWPHWLGRRKLTRYWKG